MRYLIISLSLLFATQMLSAQDCECPEFWDYQYRSMAEAMADMEGTKTLDISMQKLSAIDASIGELKNLEALDLSFNRFSTLPESFKNLENLKCLKLTGCRFLRDVPEILKDMPNLKCLDIGDHPEWSKEKFEKAKKMLPNVNVVY